MSGDLTRNDEGIVNEVTKTLHRRDEGGGDLETECGVTNHVTHDDLRRVSVDATTEDGFVRCGRCFSDAGGY